MSYLDDDLINFLLAAIAEEEAVAKAAAEAQGPSWVDDEGLVSSRTRPTRPPTDRLDMYASEDNWALWDCEGASSLGVSPEVSAHMALQDPERTLADLDAKRMTIKVAHNYRPELEHGDNGLAAFEQALIIMAHIWPHRPGFRSEWTARIWTS